MEDDSMQEARAIGEEDTDIAILDALLDRDAQRPWSLEEIAREIGDAVAASDSLARLYRAGMIHRLDGFVFASRAAFGADRIMRYIPD